MIYSQSKSVIHGSFILQCIHSHLTPPNHSLTHALESTWLPHPHGFIHADWCYVRELPSSPNRHVLGSTCVLVSDQDTNEDRERGKESIRTCLTREEKASTEMPVAGWRGFRGKWLATQQLRHFHNSAVPADCDLQIVSFLAVHPVPLL